MTIILPRTSIVDIYQGDYLDRLRHLEKQYDAAVDSEKYAPRILADIPESVALLEEHKSLMAEANETAIHVTVQAIGRKQWRTLVAAHPPRKGNEADEGMGVNEETFKDALVPVSIVSPELSESDLDTISDVDFDRLYMSAFALNRMAPSSPKALHVSPESPESDEI